MKKKDAKDYEREYEEYTKFQLQQVKNNLQNKYFEDESITFLINEILTVLTCTDMRNCRYTSVGSNQDIHFLIQDLEILNNIRLSLDNGNNRNNESN